MDKKQQLIDELIKEIKSKEEFYSIKDQIFKRGIEALLNAEMTGHLGYTKHDKAGSLSHFFRDNVSPFAFHSK